VQSARSIAWRKLSSLRDPERLRPWLVSVAANEARQLVRGQSPRRGRGGLGPWLRTARCLTGSPRAFSASRPRRRSPDPCRRRDGTREWGGRWVHLPKASPRRRRSGRRAQLLPGPRSGRDRLTSSQRSGPTRASYVLRRAASAWSRPQFVRGGVGTHPATGGRVVGRADGPSISGGTALVADPSSGHHGSGLTGPREITVSVKVKTPILATFTMPGLCIGCGDPPTPGAKHKAEHSRTAGKRMEGRPLQGVPLIARGRLDG